MFSRFWLASAQGVADAAPANVPEERHEHPWFGRASRFPFAGDVGSIRGLVDDSAVHQALDRSAALGTFVSLLAGGAADVRASLAADLGRERAGRGYCRRARVPVREL